MYEKTYKANVLERNQKTSLKEKRHFPWKRLMAIIVTLGILFGIVYFLRHPKFQISVVSVVGTTVLDVEDISSSIRRDLQGSWLWIFPRTSVLLINDKVLERNLKQEFSRIENISVKRTNLHSIEATIKEFDAIYLWCIKSIKKEEESDQSAMPAHAGQVDECYFMDKQGVVYSKAPVFSGTAYPKIFTGAPIDELPFQGILPDSISQIEELQKRLSEINITPVAFRAISPRELQVDFLHNKMVAKLLIDPTVPVETSLEYLFSGIRTQPLAGLFHNENKRLLYIDVRFSNKVVYKFDDEK